MYPEQILYTYKICKVDQIMYGHFMKLQTACGIFLQQYSKDAQYGLRFLSLILGVVKQVWSQ